MKKVIIVLAAALVLGACQCKQVVKPAGKCGCHKKAAACQCHKKAACKCPCCKHHGEEAPKLPPPPPPKVENEAAINEVANVKQNQVGATVLSFKEPINFRYNSDAIEPESVAVIQKVSGVLKKYPNAKVRVAGYTDSLGNPAYNMDLSERRAHAVAAQLVKDGVPAENVSYIGFGAANPVATNKTAEGRYQNRRVELEISNN